MKDECTSAYIRAAFTSPKEAKKAILVDFFRHGFDGSGADNFFDAGSCIDGRCANCVHRIFAVYSSSSFFSSSSSSSSSSFFFFFLFFLFFFFFFFFFFFVVYICLLFVFLLLQFSHHRLTSAWNWCSKLQQKKYSPIFLLTGFMGFDGDFQK
jgi:hypothetical protein